MKVCLSLKLQVHFRLIEAFASHYPLSEKKSDIVTDMGNIAGLHDGEQEKRKFHPALYRFLIGYDMLLLFHWPKQIILTCLTLRHSAFFFHAGRKAVGNIGEEFQSHTCFNVSPKIHVCKHDFYCNINR